MNKTEKIIREWTKKQLSKGTFTWNLEICENTIWGFKNAPYKSFTRAIKKVDKIVQKMTDEGIIMVEHYYHDHLTPTIHKGVHFNG